MPSAPTLVELKAERFRSVRGQISEASFGHRLIRRYLELSAQMSQIKVATYFATLAFNRLFGKLLPLKIQPSSFVHRGELISGDKFQAMMGKPRSFASEKTNADEQPRNLLYSVYITGGLGDAMVVARLLRDLQLYLDQPAEFDVFFYAPELIAPFFMCIKGFRFGLHETLFNSSVRYYDFCFRANQFVTFINEELNKSYLIRHAPKVMKLFSNTESVRAPIEDYIIAHPRLDGAFSDKAVEAGKKRHTYLHDVIGIPYGGDLLPIAVSTSALSAFDLVPGTYITIHDGWDNKMRCSSRPTKSIPLQTWNQIVAGIKRQSPHLKIVQLGGKVGKQIDGVDMCLVMKTTFAESLSILSGSVLHLDSESGLVHLATSLGVKCVVLFGPTNIDWFGYEQNINIAPRVCGNCWWSSDTWMDACPIGHSEPVCTSAIDTESVMASIDLALKSRGLEARLRLTSDSRSG